MSAIEPLLIEIADCVTREEKFYATALLSRLTDEILETAHDLDDSVLNMSECPKAFRARVLDVIVVGAILLRRLEAGG